MSKQSTNRVCLLLFAVMVLGCVGFIGLKRHVVLNRYTDSWWHIAVADEYLRTGLFAKDPFFQGAPPFAQFGLMDVVNAKVCALTGAVPRRVFPWLVAANGAVFLAGAFLSGYWMRRDAFAGLVSAAAWLVMFPGHTIIGIGFPFAASIPLLVFLAVSLWGREPGAFGIRAGLWRGMLLGVVFDLHAFVGLVGVGLVGVYAVAELVRHGLRRGIAGWLAFGLAFLAVSWRWLALHLALRPALAAVNAHISNAPELVGAEVTRLVGGAVLAGVTLWAVYRNMAAGSRSPEARVARHVLGFTLSLILLSLPWANSLIRAHSSGYMAARIPWLFPVGIVFALSTTIVMDGGWGRRVAVRKLVILLLATALLAPAAKTWLLKQAFLARTADYDQHAFAYLEGLEGFDLRGKIVLSDPTTSYYARGMLGVRVLTVIPGEGSPAIDYAPRHGLVRKALVEGPSALDGRAIQAVLLDKRNGAAEQFTGHAVEAMRAHWQAGGWCVAHETADAVLMMPVISELD